MDISGNVGCFVFETRALFLKSKAIWHDTKAIHPDYFYYDASKISFIIRKASKTSNSDLFRFTPVDTKKFDFNKHGNTYIENLEKGYSAKRFFYHPELLDSPMLVSQ